MAVTGRPVAYEDREFAPKGSAPAPTTPEPKRPKWIVPAAIGVVVLIAALVAVFGT